MFRTHGASAAVTRVAGIFGDGASSDGGDDGDGGDGGCGPPWWWLCVVHTARRLWRSGVEVYVDGALPPCPTKAPELGENTDDVLTSVLGKSSDEIAKLREDGALG